MKVTFALVMVLLLPLCGRAQESDSPEWSVRLDLKPMSPLVYEPLRQSLTDTSTRRKPRLVGTLLEQFGPRHLDKPLASSGIMPAEQLNVSAMRSYHRRVQEALRSLSPVMPPLYPFPFERLTADLAR